MRNTIRLVKDGTETVHNFTIRAASPSIKGIRNALPAAGEQVVVLGAGLQEITRITLPGGVEITEGINSDEDGEWYSFTMPAAACSSTSTPKDSKALGVGKKPAQ